MVHSAARWTSLKVTVSSVTARPRSQSRHALGLDAPTATGKRNRRPQPTVICNSAPELPHRSFATVVPPLPKPLHRLSTLPPEVFVGSTVALRSQPTSLPSWIRQEIEEQ